MPKIEGFMGSVLIKEPKFAPWIRWNESINLCTVG